MLFRIRGFSRNLRKEVAKSQKIYFNDLGIRNGIIQAFQPLHLRDDVGKIFENLMIIERIKRNAYLGIDPSYYFWRTYDQKEIDFIEEYEGELSAFEFKMKGGKAKIPPLWTKTYPESTASIVDQDACLEFLSGRDGDQ